MSSSTIRTDSMITFVQNIDSACPKEAQTATFLSWRTFTMQRIWCRGPTRIFGTAANFNSTLEGTFIHWEDKTNTTTLIKDIKAALTKAVQYMLRKV